MKHLYQKYGEKNEIENDFSEISRGNRRKYRRYHNRTFSVNRVRGVNDRILDLQNYEIHKIKDLLNEHSENKMVEKKILDKTLVDIFSEMGTFFYNIPDKYDRYYNSIENDNIIVKFISSLILLIVDKDNSIYIGLYLFIISIILYTINIISDK